MAGISLTEIFATALAVAYLVLVIRQNVLCWPAGLVSSLLMATTFFESRLYPETVLQLFYAAVSVYGWYRWRSGAGTAAELRVTWWPWQRHALSIGATLALAAALGNVLSANTHARFPYLDSFVSIGAVVTTYMVAKKIFENWIYWLVVDGLSLYIHFSRELYLYSGLDIVYLVLVVVGLVRWYRDWRAQPALAV